MKNLIDKNDKIFIAGHKGMVGNAISKNLEKNNYLNLLKLSKDEFDLEDTEKVNNIFYRFRPRVVIIAAAKVGGILANNNYPTDFC